MNGLQRLTTEYVDHEDRIRIAGEIEAGPTLALWLTRRLLDRLIPHLVLWLEKRADHLPRADALLSFAQQKAQSQLIPQAPVAAKPDCPHWLVLEVDIRPGEEALQLTFKGEQVATVVFADTALRQWLGIVHEQYAKGEWPMTVWPDWMGESRTSYTAIPVAMLH